MRRRALVVVAAALSVAALVGCSDDPAPAAAAPAVSVPDIVPFGSLVVDAYLRPVRGAEVVRALRAVHVDREESVRECMRAEGWEYEAVPFSEQQAGVGNPIDANLSYEEQRRWVDELGYGLSTVLPQGATADDARVLLDGPPVDDGTAGLSSAQLDAYYGSLDACAEAARLEFPQPDEGPEPVVGEEQILEVVADILADPAWIDAEQAWVPCMQAAGFDVGDKQAAVETVLGPLRAWADGGEAPDIEALQAQELAIAGADLTCLWTEVIPVQRRIEQEYAASLDAG